MKFTADVSQLHGISDVMKKAKTTARRWLKDAVEKEFIPEIDLSIGQMTRSQGRGWVKRGFEGHLKGSFTVRRVSQDGIVTVGSDRIHAKLHEDPFTPGSHSAKSGKQMTVPLSGVGISYESLKALRKMGLTRVGKFQGKGKPMLRNDVIYLKEGKKWRPIYVLRRSVRMPLPFSMGTEGYVSRAWRIAEPNVKTFLEERWIAWMQRRWTV